MSSPRLAVGVDIGGTKVLGALVDQSGAVLREHRVASPKDWPSMRDAIVSVVAELRAGVTDLHALGVGAAGMVDLDGVIHYAPNVPGFRKVGVRAALSEATGLPTVVDNDANTAAYAELRLGVARGLRDAMVITLGTGIGGGVIVDGRVLRGANGFAAEVGHFQIDPLAPCARAASAGTGRRWPPGTRSGGWPAKRLRPGRQRSWSSGAGGSIDRIDGHLVSAAAQEGVPEALALVDRYCFSVAIGLVGLANIFDPAVIAISGGVVNDKELFLEPIRRHFLGHIEGAPFRPTPEIVPAALGEEAGVIGAAMLALDRFGAHS